MSVRHTLCVSIPTGKTKKLAGGKVVPETFALPVGSAFVDETTGRINGTFHALPLLTNWDGRFVIFPPKDNGDETAPDTDDGAVPL